MFKSLQESKSGDCDDMRFLNKNTRYKISSTAASGLVSAVPVVPNYNPRDSIENLELQKTLPLIIDLKKRNQIQIAGSKLYAKHIELLNNKKALLNGFIIVPATVMDQKTFHFAFDLLFGPFLNLSNSNYENIEDEKYDKFDKVYYYYKFDVLRTTLQLIHNTIVKEMNENRNERYFATDLYPKPHSKTKRVEQIELEMKEEDEYLLLPNIPKGKSLFHKKADAKDLNNHAIYLEKLMSSSPLLLQDYIFQLLRIDPVLKKFMQHKAGTKLKTLQNIANKKYLKNPYKLTKKRGIAYEFHTLYITQRPLYIADNNFSPINFDHWALKFEGNQNLLTVEFFDDPDRDHGIVKSLIVPNTRLNRRVFWYWWERDEYVTKTKKRKETQFFTKRWETIWKIHLGCVTAECIGRLIIRWLNTKDYAIYQVAKNNCQHFVRDITSCFDIGAAKKLNSLFDHKVIASILPAVAVADGMTEEVRMYEIKDILRDERAQYESGKKLSDTHKSESKNYDNDLDSFIASQGLKIEHFRQVDTFFIESDKKRVIEYMHYNIHKNDEKWNQYFKVVEEYIKLPQNMDPEKIVEELKHPQQDTKLMNKLGDKPCLDEFIVRLETMFRNFNLD
eukprot:423245_1